MCEATFTCSERSNHVQTPHSERPDEWNSLQSRRRLVRQVRIELTSFTELNDFLSHLISARPEETGSVSLGNNRPRRRMMTTSPRVNFLQDQSTFFGSDASLSDTGHAFSVQLSIHDCERLGSADNLSSLNFILWEFTSEYVCYVGHRPIGSNHQNLHNKIYDCWDINFSRIGGAHRLLGLFSERIFLNRRSI